MTKQSDIAARISCATVVDDAVEATLKAERAALELDPTGRGQTDRAIAARRAAIDARKAQRAAYDLDMELNYDADKAADLEEDRRYYDALDAR